MKASTIMGCAAALALIGCLGSGVGDGDRLSGRNRAGEGQEEEATGSANIEIVLVLAGQDGGAPAPPMDPPPVLKRVEGGYDFGAIPIGWIAQTFLPIAGPAGQLSAGYGLVVSGTGFKAGAATFDFASQQARYEIRFQPKGLGRWSGVLWLVSASLPQVDGGASPFASPGCAGAAAYADASDAAPLVAACFTLGGEGLMPPRDAALPPKP